MAIRPRKPGRRPRPTPRPPGKKPGRRPGGPGPRGPYKPRPPGSPPTGGPRGPYKPKPRPSIKDMQRPKAKLNRAGRIAADATKAGLIAAIPGGLAFKAGQAILKSFKKKPKPPKKTQTVQKPSKPRSLKRNLGPSVRRRKK